MAANQPQKEVHRLDFFRPDQIVFLVTHDAITNEQTPNGTLGDWIANLSAQISENQALSTKPAEEFFAELCDPTRLPDQKLGPWVEKLKDQLQLQGWELVDPQPRSYSFPPVPGGQIDVIPFASQQGTYKGAFSFIVGNVNRVGPPSVTSASKDLRLMEIADDNANIPDETNAGRVRKKRRLFNLIRILNQEEMRKNLNTEEIIVEIVSPNWIASGGKSDSGGTGGPGSEPVSYVVPGKDPDKASYPIRQIPYYFQDLIETLTANGLYGNGREADGLGKDVDVVILDTAPSADDLVLAHKELVLRKDKGEKHPLVESLLGTDGVLNLHPATMEELRRMGNTSLNKHGYKMTDHGLFIAGIINSIVPGATIHLIQVLNQFGVGDIETISRGFSQAYDIYLREQRPLILNCSLCLDLPDLLGAVAYREGYEESIEARDKKFEKELREIMVKDLEEEQAKRPEPRPPLRDLLDDLQWVVGLRAMCQRLDDIGGQVVAAAGNDSQKNASGARQARFTRYPAAFNTVLGVGSLPRDAEPDKNNNNKYEASSFSNLADKPSETGIMALGGEPGAAKGVLGLYLGEFPEVATQTGNRSDHDDDHDNDLMAQATALPKPIEYGWAQVPSNNKSGWAWWAGTSFATPILTAVIASVLSGPQNLNTIQEVRTALEGAKIIQKELTSQNEPGIPSSVKQKPNPNL
jgi:hypothetical protein